jgi:hypothetical protein
MSTEITVALITMLGAIASAAIASAAILFAAKRVVDRKRLQVELTIALQDIQFLLHLESVHNDISVGQFGKDNKVKMRDVVRLEQGIDISGKNTPSRLRNRLSQLTNIGD